ncbi:MAG: ATP-binding protein [Verrucomicrobia bacterium]|nr:ATP-binding protein [Verrucomicrobiota bacterium]
MVHREELLAQVKYGLKRNPVTAILGPRQCGKTTLAREIGRQEKAAYFDLEDPYDQARLANPQLVLESQRGVVILDEIQRRPELTMLLRVLADRRPLPCRFIVLGSASPDLMRQASDSLAGRIHFVDMGGFTLGEVGQDQVDRLWLRGGFPRAFLADNDEDSRQWRLSLIRTFLERDMPQLGVQIPAEMLRRFWTMLAHYHGQIWNGSEIGASLGVSHHTTRKYLDLLCGAYVVRQLQPWFENLGKRVVKSPKVYVRDSGLLHALLGIPDFPGLQGHPKLGASWEGFVIEQILSWAGERNAYFWATHSRAELDLMVMAKGKRWGFEVKYQDAPTITKSMRIAMQDLKLERLWVVYPGKMVYPMDEKIECVPLAELSRIREILQGR